MKISDLAYGLTKTVEVQRTGGEPFPRDAISQGTEITLLRHDRSEGALLQLPDERTFTVDGANARDEHLLADSLLENPQSLFWIAACEPVQRPERLVIHIHQFPARFQWPQATDLGVDERAVEQVQRQYWRHARTTEQVVQWLSDQLILPGRTPEAPSRVFVSAGPDPASNQKRGFTLHGHSIAADIQRTDEDRLKVVRLCRASARGKSQRAFAIMLAEAPIRLCDVTVAGRFLGEARAQMERIVNQTESYLEMWGKYNELEWQSILSQAKAFGHFKYDAVEQLHDSRVEFRLRPGDDLAERLIKLSEHEETEVEAAGELPAEFRLPAQADPSGLLDEKPSARTGTSFGTGSDRRKARRLFVYQFQPGGVDASGRTITMSPRRDDQEEVWELPPQGFLFRALHGQRTGLRRRQRAKQAILEASCQMPQLGLLLEGQHVRTARRRQIEPLSPKVRAVFGKHAPTRQQIEALRIALNTPDMAVIQGPPGTGKTAVIAALQTRIAEVTDTTDGMAGLILLTSFQHDAVENAASRTHVNGFPAMIMSYRQGDARQQRSDQTAFEWAQKRIRAIELRTPDLPVNVSYRNAQALIRGYIVSPGGTDETVTLLEELIDLPPDLMTNELRDELGIWRARLRGGMLTPCPEANDQLDKAIKTVRGLRSEAVSFEDDGPIKAHKVLARLKPLDVLDERASGLLGRASDWVPGDPLPPLAELAKLRDELLERLTPDERPAGAQLPHADVNDLLTRVLDTMDEMVRKSHSGADAVLADYLHDLQNDPVGVRETLEYYTSTTAVTCSQAGSERLARLKGDQLAYDTVVVDEAARANPLDLFIPMAQAMRRLILVGDHEQLPHMLEANLEKELQKSVSEQTKRNYRMSLFERMFESLSDLQKKDGIRRTITLDTQFRMRRRLGDFVSKQFYPNTRIKSGLSDDVLQHDLPGYVDKKTGKSLVAAWIDVPLRLGRESKGQSKSRPVEAKRVASELKRLITASDKLNFGVITFYAAQRTRLQEELYHVGLMEREGEGYQVVPEYRHQRTADGESIERLRVGTVDAFQGKEFDVVLLSMTRSSGDACKDERSLRRKYGHLMLANRLCVAMSRQKRLLIVVGDAGMVKTPVAKDAVPALVAFYEELCREPDGVRLQ